MHGREIGEHRKENRHMCSVSSSRTVVDSNVSSLDCFFKAGRKISVGDSALFKPPQDSPPFIGIIHCLASVEESGVTLSVNWLYRPAEVLLGTGVAPEAAPNEVFYSFHSDEIPAVSLLHPCKVAFLPKGVELPPGVSSFVCRRVYDITHNCLWWLTDQDFIDDRQKEVNQLLHKTRIEMHATTQLQQGAGSPKPVNGSGTSPLKHSPDSMLNSGSSQTRGKRRERGDQSSEHIKHELSVRANGGDSTQLNSESLLQIEIAKIAEKGGLVDSETVERFVQLMQPEKPEIKKDLTWRSMLAGIIAATDKLDCLSQFVQLKGLLVLDEWLQEVHKGKFRDHGNIKDSRKAVEDFLLILLRALDKIPVNLNVLQTCNIGKSVNHLRTSKNIEIQKKARGLVDRWKKRVEAEINNNDAKFGLRHDNYHGGNRHTGGSSETAIRSSVTYHSSLKSTSVKLAQGDSISKSASVYSGGARSALSPTYKDGQSRMSAAATSTEPPQAVVREEKSSSSSPSQTNSQCSSDHAKNIVPAGKEDARCLTSGSRSLTKVTGCDSKQQKSANDLQGTPACCVQRETVPNRGTSVATISVVEKVSDNVNNVDASMHEINNHKFIVKIPNRGRGAAQTIAGGVLEDFSCINSRASSPALSEKHEEFDACSREKHDYCQSTEVDGSLTSLHHRTRNNDNRRLPNVSRIASSPSKNETKPKKALDSSFSSINALVESCVKFSEASASMSPGDDVGMNLLASVAAGEISKSVTVSPSLSPQRNTVASKSSFSPCASESFVQQQCDSGNIADTEKHTTFGISKVNDGEANNHSANPGLNLHQNGEDCLKSNGKLDEHVSLASLPRSSACRSVVGGVADNLNGESISVKEEPHNQIMVASQGVVGSLAGDCKVKDASLNEESELRAQSDTVVNPSSNLDGGMNNVTDGMQTCVKSEQNSLVLALPSESVNTSEKSAVPSTKNQELAEEISNEVKPEKPEGIHADHTGLESHRRVDQENKLSSMPQKQGESGLSSIDKEKNACCKDEIVENKNAIVHQLGSSAKLVNSLAVDKLEPDVPLITEETAAEKARKAEDASATGNVALSPAAGGSESDTKLGFDLNEGFSMDDARSSEPVDSNAGPCLPAISSVSPLQFPFASASCGFPASITVAAAAKGPFVPKDDLLRTKTELGWKGSAVTSAFRQAEPRKVTEMPLGRSMSSLPDASVFKQGRLPLDIDLNVADERILHDVSCQTSCPESNRNDPVCKLKVTASPHCSGGLDLDLNKVDEAVDVGQHSADNDQRLEISYPLVKVSSSSIFSNGEASGRRNFDLNNGPAAEEMPVGQTSYNQHGRSNILPPAPFGHRINNADTGNGFTWYPPGTSYSVTMTPSTLPDREAFSVVGIGSGPQRVISGPTSSLSFSPDAYRGSMLASTPAIPYQSIPFQYPLFPFGTSFPLPTSTLSGVSSGFMDPIAGGRISANPSPLVGTAAAVSFQYPHAYVVSRPIADAGNNCGVESNQKLGKQGLDLNSGPGGVDAERRDDSLPTVSRSLSAINSQFRAEEQAVMYNMAGGVLKRKEPEGGWTVDKLNFKQSSWR